MIRTHGNPNHPSNCFGCRILTVNLHQDRFQPHFNHAVGKAVTNRREYLDELKRASDKQSETTGIDADYQPVDLNDRRPDG